MSSSNLFILKDDRSSITGIINSEQEGNNNLLVYKSGIILILFAISFVFGFLPIKINYFTHNRKVIKIANAFSGGIFLCVALLHLLPESTEIFNDYLQQFNKNHEKNPEKNHEINENPKIKLYTMNYSMNYFASYFNKNITRSNHTEIDFDSIYLRHSHDEDKRYFPISFLIAFLGYTLILMSEKILFAGDDEPNADKSDEDLEKSQDELSYNNNYSLTTSNMAKSQDDNLARQFSNTVFPSSNAHYTTTKELDTRPIKYDNQADRKVSKLFPIIDTDKNTNKTNNNTNYYNCVSLKAEKEVSLTRRQRNILPTLNSKRGRINSFLDSFKLENKEKTEEDFKNLFTNIGRISNILQLNDKKNTARTSTNKTEQLLLSINKTSNEKVVSSYFLLIALSIHAVFEGMALGLQENGNQIVYMFMAITFHKWVEALSLGIKHVHINDRSYYFKVILLFSSMTPIGILIGIIFSGFSEVIEAVFLAISAGCFIYISASEIVLEEFTVGESNNEKFIAFLCGSAIISILTIFEEPHN